MNKARLHNLMKDHVEAKKIKDEIENRLKDAKLELDELESEMYKELNEMGLDMVRVDGLSITRTSQKVYNVTDWDAFYEYIYKNNAGYLLQRRVMQAGVGELIKNDHDLPIDTFTKHKLSIRKL